MSEHKAGRKVGRSKINCQSYRNSQRREINKYFRLVKHCRRQPNELIGLKRMNELKLIIPNRYRVN
jgi:hypothetical protein